MFVIELAMQRIRMRPCPVLAFMAELLHLFLQRGPGPAGRYLYLSLGMLTGPIMPPQATTSKRGTPDSVMVGMSG